MGKEGESAVRRRANSLLALKRQLFTPSRRGTWGRGAVGTILLLLFLLVDQAAAQSLSTGPWTPAYLVFREGEAGEMVWLPTMVVDPGGDVHLFWSFKEANSPHRGGNLIGYARFDGQRWSEANYVLASPSGESTNAPRVALDPTRGEIHVVWLGVTTGYRTLIYHSHAHVSAAWSARGWSPPNRLPLEGDTRSTPALWIDERGVLHVVLETTRGACYTRSGDGGADWSDAVWITNLTGNEALVVHDLLMDRRGRLHVVWAQYDTTDEMQRHIYYSRSTDGGAVWSRPTDLSGRGYINEASLATLEQDEIHVVWNGSSTDSWRFHRYSTDGGATWSDTVRILRVGGWAGRPAMAVDGSGTLHLVTAGNGYGLSGAVVHTTWDRTAWTEPELLDLGFYAEHAALTCRGGNLLIAAGDGSTPGGEGFDKVWTSTRPLEAAAVPFGRVPTPEPTPTPVPAPASPTALPTATTASPVTPGSSPIGAPGEASQLLMLGVLPAAALVMLAVFIARLRRRS